MIYINTLLEAVSKGIQNILQVDNDSSINYHVSDIESSHFDKPDLSELFVIYKEDADSIFKYNTGNAILLVLEDNTEISLHEYTSDKNPVFLKITFPELKETDNEILISLKGEHGRSQHTMSWSNGCFWIQDNLPDYNKMDDKTMIETGLADFNGYANTYNIYKIAGKLKKSVESIDFCIKYIYNGNQTYQGFLPAAGQMHIIMYYLKMLNHIITKIGFKPIVLYTGCWTSTEISGGSAFIVTQQSVPFALIKTYKNTVMPIFKKIND